MDYLTKMKFVKIALVLMLCPTLTWALPRYQKKEVMIQMRDGAHLYTAIYEPIDSVPCPDGHPILLNRTCYSCSPYGLEGKRVEAFTNRPNDSIYMAHGYIFVYQDVRGKNKSEGTFAEVRPFIEGKPTPKYRKDGSVIVNRKYKTDEASDTYETCEWLIRNTNTNGKIGVMGISYPGFYSTMAALSGHPAIKAVSPQAPVTDWWRGDDVHHNGAFALTDMFSFQPWFEYMMNKRMWDDPLYFKDLKLPKASKGALYDTYLAMGAFEHINALMGDSVHHWLEVLEHPHLDEFWEDRNVSLHCHDVKPAMMVIGGLFDAEDCYGAFETYRAILRQSPSTHLTLVEGPWSHGGWVRNNSPWFGSIYFGEKTIKDYYMEYVEYPFFAYYLEGEGDRPHEGVRVFDTGTCQWHLYTHQEWAQRELSLKPLDLNLEGRYVSDPMHPVPFTAEMKNRRSTTYMLEDQRFASQRSDVLCFKTDILTKPTTWAGPIDVELKVAISTTDADFVVKVIDVFPDDFEYDHALPEREKHNDLMSGYQMLVRWEIMRGKYRNTAYVKDIKTETADVTPTPFVPGEETTVKFRLNDVMHTFLPGHRIMIQIQSSLFPLFDRNPQQFIDIYHAKDSDYIPCEVQILKGSRIMIPQ